MAHAVAGLVMLLPVMALELAGLFRRLAQHADPRGLRRTGISSTSPGLQSSLRCMSRRGLASFGTELRHEPVCASRTGSSQYKFCPADGRLDWNARCLGRPAGWEWPIDSHFCFPGERRSNAIPGWTWPTHFGSDLLAILVATAALLILATAGAGPSTNLRQRPVP